MPRLFVTPGGIAIGRPGYGYGYGYGRGRGGGLGAAVVILVLILIIVVVATSRGTTTVTDTSMTPQPQPRPLPPNYAGFTSNDPAVQPDPDSYVPITRHKIVRPSTAPLTRPY